MAERREPPRRQVDPLLGVAAEAARAGLRGADYVVEGLSEGLRRGTGRRSAGGATGRKRAAQRRAQRAEFGGHGRATPPGAEAPSASASGGTADLFVELLGRFGETIQDAAAAIAEWEWFDREPQGPTLELGGPPGHKAAVDFAFTNTGPSALAGVTFESTDLLGATERIDAGAVDFRYNDDPFIPRVGPGGTVRVTVEVEIPELPDGTYRGVIAARSAPPEGRSEDEGGPEDAWAMLELEVAAIDPRSPITPVERSRES